VARYNDDWIDLLPGWTWQDTRSRREHDFFNGQRRAIVRAGFTCFLMKDLVADRRWTGVA
jgi:hypothetical protein